MVGVHFNTSGTVCTIDTTDDPKINKTHDYKYFIDRLAIALVFEWHDNKLSMLGQQFLILMK